MGMGVLFGLQRYIKKIGYKQDVNPRMLSKQTRKNTIAKRDFRIKTSILHTVKYLMNYAILSVPIQGRSIYKSLTKNYLVVLADDLHGFCRILNLNNPTLSRMSIPILI